MGLDARGQDVGADLARSSKLPDNALTPATIREGSATVWPRDHSSGHSPRGPSRSRKPPHEVAESTADGEQPPCFAADNGRPLPQPLGRPEVLLRRRSRSRTPVRVTFRRTEEAGSADWAQAIGAHRAICPNSPSQPSRHLVMVSVTRPSTRLSAHAGPDGGDRSSWRASWDPAPSAADDAINGRKGRPGDRQAP